MLKKLNPDMVTLYGVWSENGTGLLL